MYIIPQPKSFTCTSGNFILRYEASIILSPKLEEDALFYAGVLREDIGRHAGYVPAITKGRGVSGCIYLDIDSGMGAQSYTLIVTQEGVVITGGSSAGLWYGVQTLRQILKQTGPCIPGLHIEDEPELPNRGFYHDVARGRVPTLDYLKALADRLAYYKINQLQLYIEHSFLFRGFSEIWRDDTPLTPEDILELDAYCRRRNIELVPSISTFGHFYKILESRTYGHLRELEEFQHPFSLYDRMRHHTLDVSNPESLKLAKAMIEEFLPLFTSRQFNICADETFDLGKGKSRELAGKQGTDRIYIEYVKELCRFLTEKGIRPMFWGDIICGFPEAIGELPKDTICLNWGYEPEEKENNSRSLYEAGAVQYLCPGVAGWNQFVNRLESAYRNIRTMCGYAARYKAIGLLNTDWGDFGHINHPDLSIAGMIYGAAFSWNGKEIPFEEINRQISRVEFEDTSEQILSVAARIEQCGIFSWEHAVRWLEMGEQGKTEAEKETYFRQMDMPGVTEANRHLEQIQEELYRGIAAVGTDRKAYIHPYLLGAKGCRIFNSLGAVLGFHKYGIPGGEREDTCRLAEELEVWFYHYKKLWRTVSRESELFRLQHVIDAYADMLRDI